MKKIVKSSEILVKHKDWSYYGTEVVYGQAPVEYRRKVLKELPEYYMWDCFCKPEPCYIDIMLQWLKEQLAIMNGNSSSLQRCRMLALTSQVMVH